MRFLCADTLRASDIPHICQNCHVISYMYACRYTYGCVHTNNKNKCLYMHTCVCILCSQYMRVLFVQNRENYMFAFMAMLSFTAQTLALDNRNRHVYIFCN